MTEAQLLTDLASRVDAVIGDPTTIQTGPDGTILRTQNCRVVSGLTMTYILVPFYVKSDGTNRPDLHRNACDQSRINGFIDLKIRHAEPLGKHLP